jgi:hypothetical protein
MNGTLNFQEVLMNIRYPAVYEYIVTTDPLNRDDFDVMNVYLSHLMMAQECRNR